MRCNCYKSQIAWPNCYGRIIVLPAIRSYIIGVIGGSELIGTGNLLMVHHTIGRFFFLCRNMLLHVYYQYAKISCQFECRMYWQLTYLTLLLGLQMCIALTASLSLMILNNTLYILLIMVRPPPQFYISLNIIQIPRRISIFPFYIRFNRFELLRKNGFILSIPSSWGRQFSTFYVQTNYVHS